MNYFLVNDHLFSKDKIDYIKLDGKSIFFAIPRNGVYVEFDSEDEAKKAFSKIMEAVFL